MASKYQRLFPGVFELIGLVFVTVLVVIVGSGKQLLEYYGLAASNQVIQNNAGDAVIKGLGKLDTYSFTNEAVTFLIWAAVGLFCFSLAQAVAGGYREFKLDEDLSSNRYIHPSTFTRASFWRRVILNFLGLFIGIGLLGILLYGFFGYSLPVGLTYCQIFLQGISILNLGYFLLGMAVVYVSLLVFDIVIRFLLYRQRLWS